MSPPAEYVAMRKSVNELLSEIGAFLVSATHGQNDESDSPETGRRRSFDAQLQRFWRAYGLLRGSNDETLTVAVLALTKSGKSTLLNALTSTECLPMNNVPETARICKIVHTSEPSRNARAPPSEPWLQEPGNVAPVCGERAIRARLAELNSDVRGHHVEAHVGEEHVLHIHASIAALREYDGAGLPALALLDTPGPNEAGEEGLRHQVDRLLDSVDAVVYLLDYTKLKTAEEADMFRRLKQINPQLVKRLSQRLFFVVNKADTVDVSEGMDADDTRAYVSNLVTQQLAGEGFQLLPEQVLLVSARNALLARLVLSGKASEDVARRFSRLAFGMASSSRAVPTEAQVGEAALTLLDQSGMLDMEAQVLTFLYAHSAGVKLMATLDNLARLLWEMGNVAESVRGCLRLNVSELQVQTDSLRGKLVSTLGQFDDVLVGTDTLQSEVTDEIRAHLQSLRVRLFNHIQQTLQAREPTITAATSSLAAQRVPRRWQLLRDKFLSMFTSSTVEGTPLAKSRSREELQKLLQELHEGLMAQIHVEVGEFWSVLEACTNARHAALVRQLNAALATLSKQVEDAVTTGLNVTLAPVDISMPVPSAEQFHSDINELISKGISCSQEKHLRVGQRQVEEKVMRWREGVCQWGAYWETVPRTRTVVETYDVMMYELNPNQIATHFIELVDAAIESTSKALSSYVRTFVRSQLDAARAAIEEYSERYLSAMTAALETSHRGVESRAAALATVERHVTVLAELRAKTAALQAGTELLVPQLQDAQPYDELSDDDLHEMCGGGGVATEVPPEPETVRSAYLAMLAPTLDTGRPNASSSLPVGGPSQQPPVLASVDAMPKSVALPSVAPPPPPQHLGGMSLEAARVAAAISDDEVDEVYEDDVEDYEEEDEEDEDEEPEEEEEQDEEEEEEEDDDEPEEEEDVDDDDDHGDGSEEEDDDPSSYVPSLVSSSSHSDASDRSFSVAHGTSPAAPGSYLDGYLATSPGVSVGGSFMSCGEPQVGAAAAAAAHGNVLASDAALLHPEELESDDDDAPSVQESVPVGEEAVVDGGNDAEAAEMDEQALADATGVQSALLPDGGEDMAVVEGEADGADAAGGAVEQADTSGGPFDYSTGFVRAMSTSLMVAAEEAAAAAAADEWTLLDEDGSSASDEPQGCVSP